MKRWFEINGAPWRLFAIKANIRTHARRETERQNAHDLQCLLLWFLNQLSNTFVCWLFIQQNEEQHTTKAPPNAIHWAHSAIIKYKCFQIKQIYEHEGNGIFCVSLMTFIECSTYLIWNAVSRAWNLSWNLNSFILWGFPRSFFCQTKIIIYFFFATITPRSYLLLMDSKQNEKNNDEKKRKEKWKKYSNFAVSRALHFRWKFVCVSNAEPMHKININ